MVKVRGKLERLKERKIISGSFEIICRESADIFFFGELKLSFFYNFINKKKG